MCFRLSVPAEAEEEDQMNATSSSNPLCSTLEDYQLVPSLPNPNGSCARHTLGESSPPPPPPAAEDTFNKEASQVDHEPSSSVRLLNDDSSSRWRPWNSEFSDEENWLTSGDAGTPSRNAFLPSPLEPSMVGAGLANLGNTCFINAILQCFTHTVPLIQGLDSCTHSTCDGGVDGFCVVCAFREHIGRSLTSSGILKPLTLVDNLSHFSSNFRRFQQEDAHEFMQCALDKLESCFLDLKKNNKSFEDDNLVEKVFGGRLISRLQCCNCGHSSDTYEPLIDLSLEIENVDTLPSALESFTKVETIDAQFRCDGCKEEVLMQKQLMLDQTPSVAAFHLKRFKTDGAYVEKIDNHVDFPLELDLQPYTISSQNDNVSLKYDLYAVVVHIGLSSTSGHYFCFVRTAPDIWHRLDDTKVSRVFGPTVLSQEAYILFYARQGTPWLSSFFESLRPCLDPNVFSTSPTSVLDTVDSVYKSHPLITANTVLDEINASKEFSKQNSDYSTGERHEFADNNDTKAASIGCQPFPSGSNQDVGLDCSRDTASHAQVPCGNNAILDASDQFDGNSYFASSGLDKNNCCKDIDTGENDGFHLLTPPSSPTSDAADGSYQIPRNHLKMEIRGSSKRPSTKSLKDSERRVAVKYVKKSMPSSRGDKILALIEQRTEPSLNKKTKGMNSSPCKGRKKSKYSSVMGPVVAGISR